VVGHSITPGGAAPQLWASEPEFFFVVWLFSIRHVEVKRFQASPLLGG
jgi:hypothetical protein